MFEYEEAMERFGSDKPDLRFAMELFDLAPVLVGTDGSPASGFRVFDETLAAGNRVKGITAPGMADATRREIDELTEMVKRFGAKGLVHLAVQEDGELHGPIAKFLSPGTQAAVREAAGAGDGDLILVIADAGDTANDVLGRLRVELGGRLALADPDELAYCWVHHFPMYQWDEPFKRWDATHNPFSGVVPEDEVLLTTASGDLDVRSPEDPAGRAKAMQYDVALNGWELGGGSVRIWKPDLLARSFNLQGYTREQMRERFGAMLEAFEYGAPPHGGHRARRGPLGRAPQLPDEHPRGHGLPQDPVGLRPDARGAVRAGRGPVRRSSGCASLGCPASPADRRRLRRRGREPLEHRPRWRRRPAPAAPRGRSSRPRRWAARCSSPSARGCRPRSGRTPCRAGSCARASGPDMRAAPGSSVP